ncbi:MAG: transcriptional regulator [Candidatus Bathyarchaeota archaeon]
MPKRDDMEHRALLVIMNKGTEGILQSDLWRELKVSGRDGSRISLKLENKNLIKRQKELFGGRWTYRLFAKKRPIEIETILDIPCVSCPNISKCEANSEVSPNLCVEMTRFLLSFNLEK